MQTVLFSLNKVRLRDVKWLTQELAARRFHQTLETARSFYPLSHKAEAQGRPASDLPY